MIKAIKNFFSRNIFAIPYVIIPSVDKHKLLAEVWGDSSVRTDIIKWYGAEKISNFPDYGVRSVFIVDDGRSEYPETAWYSTTEKLWFCDSYGGEWEGKPMEPQPTMFALLPKLNG